MLKHRLVKLRACVLAAAVFAALGIAACGDSNPPAAPAATVSSVAVSGTAPAIGATVQFSAAATLSNGTTQAVTSQATWTSSNASVVSVNAAGVVSGVGPGEADITATYQNVAGRMHVSLIRVAPQTFTLSGTVTDGTSGGVLPNIDLRATDSAGNTIAVKSGSTGSYSIGGLAAGQVSLAVSAVSYQTATLTVGLAADTRLDVVLQRVVCSFTVSPPSFTFSAAGGQGTVTIASSATGCTWTASSNDAFVSITSNRSGLDNATVTFSVAPNPFGFLFEEPLGQARSGTLTIAGVTITVRQDAATLRFAAYDPGLAVPVCQDAGSSCSAGGLIAGAGPREANQPNTIFNACADGRGTMSIEVIVVASSDGAPLAAGKPVKIFVQAIPGGPVPQVFLAADARRADWVQVQTTRQGNTLHTAQAVLPAGAGLQAIRVAYSGAPLGPGPCANSGPDFDNDDLVFRVE